MAETVAVNRAALGALIEYADQARTQRDSEFCVGTAEHEASEAEFTALVDALGITPDEPAACPVPPPPARREP